MLADRAYECHFPAIVWEVLPNNTIDYCPVQHKSVSSNIDDATSVSH